MVTIVYKSISNSNLFFLFLIHSVKPTHGFMCYFAK